MMQRKKVHFMHEWSPFGPNIAFHENSTHARSEEMEILRTAGRLAAARIIFSTIIEYSFAAYKVIIFSLRVC